MRYRSVLAALVVLAVCLAPVVAQTLTPSPSAAAGQAAAGGQAPPAKPAGGPERPPDRMMPREPGQLANVRFEVTIADQVGTAAPIRKTLTLIVADGRRGMIRSYITMPATEKTPVRRYSLNLDVLAAAIEGSNIRLNLSLEYNPPEARGGEAPPESSFQQSGYFVLESGRPATVAQWPDPLNDRDRRVSVEVKGTIVK